MPTKKQEDWGVFKIFERVGLLVALSVCWIVLVSAPLDLLMVYLDPRYLIFLHGILPGFMGFSDWLNNFFSYWREIWQWPIIFYSLFFLVGRILFKDWNKTNLLVWVVFAIAYLNLVFFNTGLDVQNLTIAIGSFVLYPMLILAPANLNIYPEFGALLFIAGYDLLKRTGFDTSLNFILRGDEKKNALDKVINPNL
ncbi:MAG: hypothetical protein PHW52_04350 [Candidatus Pacebacteria bacterium]|nr:hypothetical protein [Candidatus Paceibacterota bacterium]